MQADSVTDHVSIYDLGMPGGRPPKFNRSEFGQRLYDARIKMGYSQMQMAELLGVTQPSYAAWERVTTALRPDHLSKLATILNVSVEHLLGHNKAPQRGTGPVGKMRRVFEEVSRLPRNRQQHIIRVVEELLAAQRIQKQAA
jgi:transcriptional regulator with XRE-family HTH domain